MINSSSKLTRIRIELEGTTEAPADVVDGATGERRKMMRAQLRGARRYYNQVDSESRAKRTTKVPPDVVDEASGEQRKMMREPGAQRMSRKADNKGSG